MSEKFFRYVSAFLALIMLVNIVPVQALGTAQSDPAMQAGTVTAADSTEDAIVAELPEGRTEYTKEFLLSNGLHMAAVYDQPVHYEKDGKWENINNTLTAAADGTYKNTAGVWEVSFPQSSNQAVTIQKDGYTLSFGMPQRLVSSGTAVMSLDAEPMTAADAQASTAQLQPQADNSDEPENLSALSSRLTYESIHANTDLIYDLTGNKVKESVVLERYDSNLRGFRYILNVGTMIPVLLDDGSIHFYAPDKTTLIMAMPAPYMVDDQLELSTDVQVQLSGSGSRYVLTYTLPQSWLAAEERQWPVILDPVVQADLDTENIRDVIVASTYTFSHLAGFLDVGYGPNPGIKRSFVKYTNLPKLKSSDVVVSAAMSMYHMHNRYVSVPVEVHKVLGTWESETLHWSNKPDYDPIVDDFVLCSSERWYTWDVTDIVQQWYLTGNNTGMMFKTTDAWETGGTEVYRQFLSSDYGIEGKPTLQILFRNNNGVESYWDYTVSSAGRAGTGYVNDYTGNLTWIRSDLGFGGNRMPVAIQHVYNANDTAEDSFSMGYGWRTTYNQSLYQWDADGDGTIQSDETYYVWEDADGTDHYFCYSEEKEAIVDEDGLELTLTVHTTGDSKYILTDKNGGTYYFDTQGRLYKIENNQKVKSSVSITYTDGTGNRIDKVTDGVGRIYDYQYTDGMLTKIAYYGTGETEIASVSYSYTNDDLTGITDNDGDSTAYTYHTGHILATATDVDGYQLRYAYTVESSDYAPCRVEEIQEFDGTAEGGHITIIYGKNQTVFTDEVNGTTQISQFNNFGNTVAVIDDEGRAQYAQFARNDTDDTAGKANQLTLSSKLQNTVINLLSNSSFEGDTLWASGTAANTGFLGSRSLQLSGVTTLQSPGFTAKAGKTYTVSGYVKTDSGKVKLGITDGITSEYSEAVSASDWVRLQVSFTNSGETDKTLYALFEAEGLTVTTGYLDCVQAEEMPTASRYNLIQNGDFTTGAGWTGSNLAEGDTVAAAPTGFPMLSPNAYKITGEYETVKSVKQTIPVSGTEGDSFVFGGWAMGNSASLTHHANEQEKDFAIKCTVYNGETVVKEETVSFNDDVSQWQLLTGAIAATGDYTSVTVELIYKNNANTVYFDGIQLFKEEFGVSYTYDDEGNVISVIDLQKKETEYEYDQNSNLTAIIEDGANKMEYTYDDYHNVLTAKTEEGYEYHFTYDDYGNNTAVSTTEGGLTISSSATYTDNGNHMASATDVLGNVTRYGYDADTGLLSWVQYPKDTADTRTEYTYDAMFRQASATADINSTTTLSAEYTYTDDYLTAIETPSTTYSFQYGNFGLRSAVTVGTDPQARYTLAEYSYDASNRLQKLDYGNQDSVQYEYDKQGRLTKETYEDGDTVRYAYDNSGNLATVTDSETGTVTTYYYDLLNRDVGYREKNSTLDHSVVYAYNADNLIESITETVNGVSKTYTYTYNEYDRLVSETVDGTTVTYTYDDFGRLSNQVTKQGDTTVLSEPYMYVSPATGVTSTQVYRYRTTTATGNSTWYYTYDQNGNITYVDSSAFGDVTYEYDSQGQLLWEYSNVTYYATQWEYDDAGNILSRKVYDYYFDEIDSLYRSDTYSYTDTQWGDLLTGYNGRTITYDGIGNPVSDGIWTYAWQHGRQLASMTSGSTTWTYTYNSDGLRTKKTDGTNTYTYIYNGSKLTAMTKGSDTLYFTYDAVGTPLTVTYNGTVYYYGTNLQGEIAEIYNAAGTMVVGYRYNAYGELDSMFGSMADTLGTINPLRYRGYVYDTETKLYYLQSRYYNPEWGRFINADKRISCVGGIIKGYNLFAYCFNNPVAFSDPFGDWSQIMLEIGKLAGEIISVLSNYSSLNNNSISGQFSDGIFSGSGSITGGYGEIMFRGQGDKKFNSSSEPSVTIGVFSKASVGNASGQIGIGNKDLSVSAKGVGDVLTASGQLGLKYDDGLGLTAKAKASVASGRATLAFNIFGWQVEFGVSGDVLSIGAEATIGIFDGAFESKINASLGFGGGFILRIKPPQ